jgi:predicted dehydrogenase
MSGEVRIGILGTARIAERALIEPARAVPSVIVAAVAAREKARAETFALQRGMPGAYGSYEELLASPDIDAVYVPLPNSLHAPWTLWAIAAGKHVLCEKPFASNAAEAASVAAAGAGSGLVVMEAMHYRYHPLVKRMVSLVRDGAIGTPRHIQCWTSWPVADMSNIRYDYALGGGALMDGGCYAIDCLRLVAESAGAGDAAVTAAIADPLPDQLVDRAMAARLAFSGELTGWFESSFTRDGEFYADVHVIGSEGHLRLRNFVLAHAGQLYQNGSLVPGEPSGDPGDTTFAWQLRAFSAAVTDGAPFPTTAANAVGTMRLIDDVYRAAGLPPRATALQAFAVGYRGGFGAAGGAQLGEDVGDVHAGGLRGDEQLRADLAVGQAAGEQAEHLAFTVGQGGGHTAGVVPVAGAMTAVAGVEAGAAGQVAERGGQWRGAQPRSRPSRGAPYRRRLVAAACLGQRLGQAPLRPRCLVHEPRAERG